jgi:hypothetical protein
MSFRRGQIGLNRFQAGKLCGYRGYLLRSRSMVVMGMVVVRRVGVLRSAHIHIDEGAQAVVLAEVATRVFVAGCVVSDVGDGFEADECGRLGA